MSAVLAPRPAPAFVPPLPPRLSVVRSMSRELRVARVLDVFTEECLSLDARDARQLEKVYGWSAQASLRLGVRSVPSHVAGLVVCSELRRIVGDSDEWPAGFYLEGGLLRFDCPREYGLVVPVWRRWPVGLQYYRHAQDERPRWITSASRETGTAAVASIHCQASMSEPREVTRAFVVEDTLRSMAVALKYGVACVGLNGAAVSKVPAQMFEAFAKLGAVVLAVKDAPPRLERELRDAGLNVTFWNGGALL